MEFVCYLRVTTWSTEHQARQARPRRDNGVERVDRRLPGASAFGEAASREKPVRRALSMMPVPGTMHAGAELAEDAFDERDRVAVAIGRSL